MEVIRGRERDYRQEVRSAVERGGTRPTRRVDPQRQAFRAAADEGPHPAEGGRIGTRRRLERRPDCRGAGHQHRHYRADQAPAGRGGVRGGVEAQIQSQFRSAADFRRRSRSKIDRADPLSGPGGFRPLEPAPARGEGRRTAHCRARQRQHDRADAKKNILKPHRKQQWVIPPDASAAFVADMEDVLEVYQRPHDPQRPLVCLDETSKQLIIETRAPIPAKPGRKARHDYEYERNGVANLFMVFAPLEGWRHVTVTDRHTAIDYAHMLRDLSDVHFPAAAKILHGRIRTRRARVAVSGSPHRRQANPRPRSQRMAGPPQQAPRQGQLAIQNRRRPCQAEETVPSVRLTRATRNTVPPRSANRSLSLGSSRAALISLLSLSMIS